MANNPDQLSEAEMSRLARDAESIQSEAIAYASTLSVFQAGNDAVLNFARPRPAMLPSGQVAPFMKAETTAIVYVSMQTLKDFYLVLKNQIEHYEKVNGKIVTEYSKKIEQS